MPTFHEILPETKSCKHCSIRWTPSQTHPGGHLEVSQGRKVSEYLVVELQADHGTAARFCKVGANPSAEDASYDVFLPSHGSRYYPHCTCRGFSRHSLCKHTASLAAIIENRWLPGQLAEAREQAEVAEAQAEFVRWCFEETFSGGEVPF